LSTVGSDTTRQAVAVDHPVGGDASPVSAVSVRGRPVRKAPLGWLPWAALALAALLALVMLLVALNVTDVGDDRGVDVTDDPSGQAAAAPAPAPAPAADAGTVVAANGGASLLPVPGDGLGGYAGQTVQGRGVVVQSVVADEGFWVGADETNRLFVHLSDAAKASQGESPFQVKAGQRVDFTGIVTPAPADAGALGVTAAEGADRLRTQGQYLELSSVALTG
jgi:hypothetical protein